MAKMTHSGSAGFPGGCIAGTAARKLPRAVPTLPQDPCVARSPKAQPKPGRRLFTVAVAVGLVALVIMSLVSLSGLLSLRAENQQLREQISDAEALHQSMQATLDSVAAPAAVETYAAAHGMVKPGPGQIVYITLPQSAE